MESNGTIFGLKLRSWQNDAARRFLSLKPKQRFVIKSARQRGKSTFVQQVLFYVAINRPRSKSYYVAPTLNQSRLFFQNMMEVCEGSPLIKSNNASTLEITFSNRSKIFFRSAEQGEHLRGGTTTGITILDELAFISDDFMPIILPYNNVKKTNVIAISTPLFRDGTFYEWWQKAYSGDPNYVCLDVNDYPYNFFISDDQIAEYRDTLAPLKFKQEIMGEFGDLSESVFGDFLSILKEPEDKEVVYGGIDFSVNGGDDTVFVGLNRSGSMVCMDIVTDIEDTVDRAEALAEIIRRHPKMRSIVCEKNSMGQTYIDLLKRKIPDPSRIVEFVTSNDSKKRVIEQLIVAISKREITMLPHPKLKLEFSIYERQPLKGGNYTYNNRSVRGGHDDIVMATAFAYDAYNKANKSGGYSTAKASSIHKRKLSHIYG